MPSDPTPNTAPNLQAPSIAGASGVTQRAGSQGHIAELSTLPPTAGSNLDEVNRRFEEEQAQFNATQAAMPYISLYGFPPNPQAIMEITEEDARRAEIFPFFKGINEIRVGTPNPKNPNQGDIIHRLELHGLTVKRYFISRSSFNHGLLSYKDIILTQKTQTTGPEIDVGMLKEIGNTIEGLQDLKEKIKVIPVTKTIDLIIAGAFSTKASDIHLEPEENSVRLRYRLDGVLQTVSEIPSDAYKQVVSRVKLLSKMKLNVTDIPQDGRFSVHLPERTIDIRVSTLPSAWGESIVMRLLGTGAISLKIDDLGFIGHNGEIIKKQLEKPNGMILTTGPTGSGKTTTLYAFLNELNSPDNKIITLEDPIEYKLQGIEQVPINHEAGLDFAKGLRAILRQDPDIVMVGEIRDLETAEIALQAALTGHVVFSTLHTNDAAGALPRLINMGVAPFIIAPAINAVIGQRLVRRLCIECRSEYTPSPEQITELKTVLGEALWKEAVPNDAEVKLWKPGSCAECHFTGYKGRMGIYEVFAIDDEMEKLIMQAATVAEIRDAAVVAGMVLMQQDGIMKALHGITDIEEVRRVASF